MKAIIEYRLEMKAMERICIETEKSIDEIQRYEIETNEEIKKLMLECSASVNTETATLYLQVYNKRIKQTDKTLRLNYIVDDTNLNVFLKTILSINLENKSYDNAIEKFKEITKKTNTKYNLSALYDKSITEDELIELTELADKIQKLDIKFLRKESQMSGSQEWAVLEYVDQKIINSLDVNYAKKVLESYKVWKEQDKDRQIEELEEKIKRLEEHIVELEESNNDE